MYLLQTLKDFLIYYNGKYIIEEYDKHTGMSDRNRKALMNHAIDLMVLHFGLHPGKKHKIMVAEAIVALFGKLKTHPSSCNGIVSLDDLKDS